MPRLKSEVFPTKNHLLGTPGTEVPNSTTSPHSGQRKSSPRDANPTSLLDATARLLEETRTGYTCQEIIQILHDRGWWRTPGGKNPVSTLRHQLEEDVKKRGVDARFVRHDIELDSRAEIIYGLNRGVNRKILLAGGNR
jgi:hypothetical protein